MKVKRRLKSKHKFVKPKTGLRPQGPVKQVGPAGVRFHQGYVRDQLRYTVLTCKQMSAVDRDRVLATLKTITTGPEAATLPDGMNGWRAEISNDKRTIILSYRGIEVALFYQRQLTPITLQPGDKHPEGVMQDPTEAWQRFDLLGKSAKQKNVVLVNVHSRLQEENKLLLSRIADLKRLTDELESKVFKAASEKEEHEQRYRCIPRKKRRK